MFQTFDMKGSSEEYSEDLFRRIPPQEKDKEGFETYYRDEPSSTMEIPRRKDAQMVNSEPLSTKEDNYSINDKGTNSSVRSSERTHLTRS